MISKVIVTCEHASSRIPPAFESHLRRWMNRADEHLAWDPGAATIAHAMARELKAPCFDGRWTRLLVDLNRSTHHRRLHAPPLASLPRDQLGDLVRRYYRPYRENVEGAVKTAIAAGFQVIHLSVHSFVPVFHGVDRRTDFALLYDPRRIGERTFSRRWLKQISRDHPDWRLRSNHPYRGTADGHTTALRKLWAACNYLGLELEFSQGLPLATHGRTLGRTMAQSLRTVLAT